MQDLLHVLSAFAAPAIIAAFAVHLAFFALLWVWARRDMRIIASSLAEFTRDLRHRSVLDATGHLSDQIEAFLADVNDVLSDPSRTVDREALLGRMNILDERRAYLHSLRFETGYNLCRTMIEAYPLAGVLGTIMAIGSVLDSDTLAQSSSAVSIIVQRFGDSIWATFAGLLSAILLMFLNSLVEPGFERLAESRAHVRETVARTKRELALPAGGRS